METSSRDSPGLGLEDELNAQPGKERFEPPEAFNANALIRDISVHKEAVKNPAGWWLEQPRALDWFQAPWQALDDDPPFYKWFEGGKVNASGNCLDRHVAGLGDRVAFNWGGEKGESRDIT